MGRPSHSESAPVDRLTEAIAAGPTQSGAPFVETSSIGRYEWGVVVLLALLQFTLILDFMVLAPLGAILMPELQITPAEFGMAVSTYALSAGFSGFLAAGFADRFDRKSLLMFFYTGFLAGTFLCGMATSYPQLLFARMVTGLFGGVIGSIVFAIITDVFPVQMRGRVFATVQTAFAVAQVLGLPIGVALGTHFSWHLPFQVIGILGLGTLGWIAWRLRPLRGHLLADGHTATKSPLGHLAQTLTDRFYLQSFLATALLSTGGFMLMPFGSAFSVHNLGIPLTSLPIVYVATGLTTILAAPWIGRVSDRVGSFPVFAVGSVLSILCVTIYTHLGPTPLPVVIAINSALFVTITSRIISSSALMSQIPSPSTRGSFMAVSASLQQLAGGVAAALAGQLVRETPSGAIEHFDRLGWVVAGAIVITLILMRGIDRRLAQARHRPLAPT